MASRGGARLRVEPLECRLVPAGFALAGETVSVVLPADATAFPVCDIDVLADDSGTNLRIVAITPPVLGAGRQGPGR